MKACRLAACAAVFALALPAGAGAQAVEVGGGSLDWTMANVYDMGAPKDADHTWLGYVTGALPLATGTATPGDGATGPTVTPASARGRDRLYTTTYRSVAGTYDFAAGAGTLDFRGALTFHSEAHRFTITVESPRLVLDGAGGQLLASGKNTSAKGSYGYADGAVFALDLSAASVVDRDGVRTISGIVPRIATAGVVFPGPGENSNGGYGVGAGPDRTPNTFGAFAVRIERRGAPASPVSPTAGAGSAPAAKAVTRTTGRVRGTARGARVVVKLAADLGTSARKALAVKLVFKGRVVATGRLHRRTLTLRVAKTARGTYPLIRGPFTIRASSAKTKLLATHVTIK